MLGASCFSLIAAPVPVGGILPQNALTFGDCITFGSASLSVQVGGRCECRRWTASGWMKKSASWAPAPNLKVLAVERNDTEWTISVNGQDPATCTVCGIRSISWQSSYRRTLRSSGTGPRFKSTSHASPRQRESARPRHLWHGSATPDQLGTASRPWVSIGVTRRRSNRQGIGTIPIASLPDPLSVGHLLGDTTRTPTQP
ncbi:hypothetical protein SAMN05519103_06244 [Rhizobiales bacterium GAS113]|nr:hypothetical protein SAMN05519103_06244 [Rhizobiales bacterium GAS113]